MKSVYLCGLLGLFILQASPSAYSADTGQHLLNLDKKGVALQGYDPVAFFSEGKPVMGDSSFTSVYQGATYQFSTVESKSTFEAEPAKFAPQFGGFCAYGVSRGYTAPIKIDAFQIVDGRLLMQYDTGARELFNKNPQASLEKADANWPALVAKKGK